MELLSQVTSRKQIFDVAIAAILKDNDVFGIYTANVDDFLIDPQSSRVEIYRQGRETEILENPTELSGEAVLPGFILNLARILN
jgi:hypothetical protein